MNTIFNNVEEIKISNQKMMKILYANIIKKVETQYGPNFYIYDKSNDVCFWANSLLKAYINKILDKLTLVEDCYYVKDSIEHEDHEDYHTILYIQILNTVVNGKTLEGPITKCKKSQKEMQKFNLVCFMGDDCHVDKTERVLDITDNDIERFKSKQ